MPCADALEGTAAGARRPARDQGRGAAMFEIAKLEAAPRTIRRNWSSINGELAPDDLSAPPTTAICCSRSIRLSTRSGLLRHSTFVLPGSIELAHREHQQIIRRSATVRRKRRQNWRASTFAILSRCGCGCTIIERRPRLPPCAACDPDAHGQCHVNTEMTVSGNGIECSTLSVLTDSATAPSSDSTVPQITLPPNTSWCGLMMRPK